MPPLPPANPTTPPATEPAPRCPHCGAEGRTHGDAAGVRACERCQLRWLDPRPTQAALQAAERRMYRSLAALPHDAALLDGRWQRGLMAGAYNYRIPNASPIARVMGRLGWATARAGRPILWVGRADGPRLLVVSPRDPRRMARWRVLGWDVRATLDDADLAARASQAWSMPVHPFPPEQVRRVGVRADAVALERVLDRTHDPRRALGSIWDALEPGGVLSLTTSDGRRARPGPERLRVYTTASLRSLLRAARFDVMWIRGEPAQDDGVPLLAARARRPG